MLLELVALVFVTVLLIFFLIKHRLSETSDFWKKRGFPTVTSELNLLEVIRGKFPFDLDREYYNELGDEKFGGCVEIGVPILLVKDLELAKHILVKDFDTFFDRRDFGKSDPIFSESLFFLQGQTWKNMRSFLSPTFTSGKIKRMFQHMDRTGRLMAEYVNSPIHPKDGQGRALVILPLMRKFAVEVIGTAVFGMETNVFTDPNAVFFKWAMKTAEFDIPRKLRLACAQSFPRLAEWLGMKLIDGRTHEFLRRTLADGIKLRKQSTETRDDFIQLLVEAMQDEQRAGGKDTSQDILKAMANPTQKFTLTENMAVGQGFVFFFAGMDTVSMFLSFAVYEMALNPDIQERMYEEVEKVMGTCDKKVLTNDDVNGMKYLHMFSSELLRLYPPLVRIERKCMKDYPIPGTDKFIPKGTLVGITADGIHRDQKYFPNPDKFDPERFNTENNANRHPYAYMPFGLGPRNCIGMRFAQIESTTALAYLIHSFRIEPTQSTPIPVKYKIEAGGYKIHSDLELRFVSRQ